MVFEAEPSEIVMSVHYLADTAETAVSYKEFLSKFLKQLTKELVKTHCILSLPLWEAVVVANPSLLGTTTGPFKETYVHTTSKIQTRHRIDSQAQMC